MDVSSQPSLAMGPTVPDLSAVMKPVVLEDATSIQAFLPPANLSLEAVASNTTQSMVLAQQFDQDILGDLGKIWNTFIESGQVWALIIGIVIGYMVRSLTAY